jgi:hypothetical protein
MVMVLVLFYFNFFPFCPPLDSLPFVCYLTNKDLGHRRFHFTSHGTCFFWSIFFFFPSCPLFIFYFPILSSIYFIFCSFLSSFDCSSLRLLCIKQGLGA